MEEFIKYCSIHKYPVSFHITDKRFVIEFFMAPNNYRIIADLYRELDFIYLGDVQSNMSYDHNTGIKFKIELKDINDKEDVFKNIMNYLDTAKDITYPELEYELLFKIMHYLRKLGVNRINTEEHRDTFRLDIIHHKNIELPYVIASDELLHKETKENYVKDTLYIVEYEELKHIYENLNKKEEDIKLTKKKRG